MDNTAVRESQIKRLKELRANRDEAAVKKALEAITECVKTGKGKKITVMTYKPKKGEKRKMGHRQPYTKVQIEAINA